MFTHHRLKNHSTTLAQKYEIQYLLILITWIFLIQKSIKKESNASV